MDPRRRCGAELRPVRPTLRLRQAARDPPRRRHHPLSRSRLRPRRAPHQKIPLPNISENIAWPSGADSHAARAKLEGMNFAATDTHPRKSASRSRAKLSIHPSSFGFHPSSAPLSPQTPSLPDARPRSDRFRCGGRESKFLAATTGLLSGMWMRWKSSPRMAVHRSGPGGLALRLMVQGNESTCEENGDVVPHSRGEIEVRTGKKVAMKMKTTKGLHV